jgi:hypothetical protein
LVAQSTRRLIERLRTQDEAAALDALDASWPDLRAVVRWSVERADRGGT